MRSTIEKMLPFPLEEAPLLLPPQFHVMSSMMEARPQRKSLFQGHKMTFPLLCDPGLAVPALHAAANSHHTFLPHCFLSQDKQRPGAVPDHVPEK